MGMERFLTSFRRAQNVKNSDGWAPAAAPAATPAAVPAPRCHVAKCSIFVARGPGGLLLFSTSSPLPCLCLCFVVVMASSVVRTHTHTHARKTHNSRGGMSANQQGETTNEREREAAVSSTTTSQPQLPSGGESPARRRPFPAVAASAAPHALSNPTPC